MHPPDSGNQRLVEQLARQAEIEKELAQLVGLDADFELQTVDTPPAAPWGQGPNSVVKILSRPRVPRRSTFDRRSRRAHANRGEYDGFGIQLPLNWKADTHQAITTSFDFRCADVSRGGDGSWRYYVGHGPGNSAAVELFFNGHQLFARTDNDRPAVATLRAGTWYQVQLTLNLREQKYAGIFRSLDAGEPSKWSLQALLLRVGMATLITRLSIAMAILAESGRPWMSTIMCSASMR